MIKNKKHINMSSYEKDPVAGEVDTKAMQIKHTPMGTTVEPAKFQNGDRVRTTEKFDTANIEIPEGITLCVSGVLGDDMYNLIGPENLKIKLNGAYLEKVKEDKHERVC